MHHEQINKKLDVSDEFSGETRLHVTDKNSNRVERNQLRSLGSVWLSGEVEPGAAVRPTTALILVLHTVTQIKA